jgi:tryptophan 2,3-dioxygenase
MLGTMAEGNPFDGSYGAGTTEYERYLRTPELLGLQKPPDRWSHPDELMFQSIHQVEEIWMKLMVHELGEAVVAMDADRFTPARDSIQRACQVEVLLEQQLKLFETMLPNAYLAIRAGLGAGSGLDSPGFNRMNEIAPTIWSSFSRAVERQGLDLLTLYQTPTSRPEVLGVAEALVTLDAQMQRFKREHMMTVKRIIGIGTASLRGNPIEMLERSAKLTYFPMLWAVRDRMFIDFRSGGPMPY